MVVSDHGMTESGNHGGSSYEETDSLALFVGLKNGAPFCESAAHNSVHQVTKLYNPFHLLILYQKLPNLLASIASASGTIFT